MREKIIPVTLEDLTIEERLLSARTQRVRRELIDRQPDNMSSIKLLQKRYRGLSSEIKEIHQELDERWKREVINTN
mgnify:CR=1 FL=1